LINQGMKVSSKRVARLMRLAGLRGMSRRRGFVVTTRRAYRKSKSSDQSTPVFDKVAQR
jgi:putative transposase